jgi:hypothetical protein
VTDSRVYLPHVDVDNLVSVSFFVLFQIIVVAQYLEKYPEWDPDDIWSELEAHSVQGTITNVPISVAGNLLLNTGDLLRAPVRKQN